MMIVGQVAFEGNDCRDSEVPSHHDCLNTDDAVLPFVVHQFLTILCGKAEALGGRLGNFWFGLVRYGLRQAGHREAEYEQNREGQTVPGRVASCITCHMPAPPWVRCRDSSCCQRSELPRPPL